MMLFRALGACKFISFSLANRLDSLSSVVDASLEESSSIRVKFDNQSLHLFFAFS